MLGDSKGKGKKDVLAELFQKIEDLSSAGFFRIDITHKGSVCDGHKSDGLYSVSVFVDAKERDPLEVIGQSRLEAEGEDRLLERALKAALVVVFGKIELSKQLKEPH